MRLLTANLYTGRASLSSFGAILDIEQPDVVVCQEVGTEAAEMLRRRFSHGFAAGDDHTHSGRAMVSNEPLEVMPLDLAHRPGLRARIDVGGADVELIGIHLANPVMGVGAIVNRRRQTRSVIAHLDTVGTPAVVVGDLNATPVWPSYRRLRTRLRDGVADASRRNGRRAERTWAPRPGLPPILRIDHILAAGVIVDDVEVHRVEGSDHSAVAATLKPVGG